MGSDDVKFAPLALLDPDSLNMTSFWETPDPFVRSRRHRRNDGVKPRFLSSRNMKRGDMLLFRSSDVAHGTARVKTTSGSDHSRASTVARWPSNRISFDMRCRCT